MSDTLRKYEEKFNTSAPMPEQIEEAAVVKVAADHLAKGEPIPADFDWWALIPEEADA